MWSVIMENGNVIGTWRCYILSLNWLELALQDIRLFRTQILPIWWVNLIYWPKSQIINLFVYSFHSGRHCFHFYLAKIPGWGSHESQRVFSKVGGISKLYHSNKIKGFRLKLWPRPHGMLRPSHDPISGPISRAKELHCYKKWHPGAGLFLCFYCNLCAPLR